MKTLLSVLVIAVCTCLGAFLPPTKQPNRVDTSSSRQIDSLIKRYREEAREQEANAILRLLNCEREIQEIGREMPPYPAKSIAKDPGL